MQLTKFHLFICEDKQDFWNRCLGNCFKYYCDALTILLDLHQVTLFMHSCNILDTYFSLCRRIPPSFIYTCDAFFWLCTCHKLTIEIVFAVCFVCCKNKSTIFKMLSKNPKRVYWPICLCLIKYLHWVL